jgi:hypothetical protein
MNIGRPQRIIEIEPASPPLPDPIAPMVEPGPAIPEIVPEPEREPRQT